MRNGKKSSRSETADAGLSRREALYGIAGLGGLGLSALTTGCGEPDGEKSVLMDMEEPTSRPTPKELLSGIDAICILMMENRSFDHYLGALKSDAAYSSRNTVDGLRGGESNLDPNGQSVTVFRTKNRTPKDPPHGWDACRRQWNAGKNDGFIKEYARLGGNFDESEVMGYHDRAALPLYYSLADRFTVCDRWFASVMGPTWPNRFYLHAGSSFGKRDNTPLFDTKIPTLWDRLRAKGLRGKNYYAGLAAFYSGGFLGKTLTGQSPAAKLTEFFEDARAGTLPPFSIIDPDFYSNDDHPSHDINLGQALVATVVQAIAQSPQWPRILFVITYDEHGGFFDHVSPPTAEDEQPEFCQLGFRVPTICIGGSVGKGMVNSTVFEHASVAATLRTRFDIDSLGRRMDEAADLSSLIDPNLLTHPAPPPTALPKVKVNLREALRRTHQAESSQPELHTLSSGATRAIPRQHLDERPTDERLHALLREGVALGAVELD